MAEKQTFKAMKPENPGVAAGEKVTPSGAPYRGDPSNPSQADGVHVTANPDAQKDNAAVALTGAITGPLSNLPQTQGVGGVGDDTDARSLQAQPFKEKASMAQGFSDKTGADKLEAFANTYDEALPDTFIIFGRAIANVTLHDLANTSEVLQSVVNDYPEGTPDTHVVASNGGIKLTLGDCRAAVKEIHG